MSTDAQKKARAYCDELTQNCITISAMIEEHRAKITVLFKQRKANEYQIRHVAKHNGLEIEGENAG